MRSNTVMGPMILASVVGASGMILLGAASISNLLSIAVALWFLLSLNNRMAR